MKQCANTICNMRDVQAHDCTNCSKYSIHTVDLCEMYIATSFAREKDKEINKLKNMLEDVVNELDLSETVIDKHGPLGTPPAELVRLVLVEKDKTIAMLKSGMKHIDT